MIFSGEGDRLGGLIVDIFNNIVVIQSSALWVEHYRSNIETALKNTLGTSFTYLWKQSEVRLKQDGYETVKSGSATTAPISSNTISETIILENIKLNNINSDIIHVIKQDAVEYMRLLQTTNQSFDIVICDPPKLAPTRSSLPRAISKYIKINTLGLSLVKPGGLFLTCSCSAAVTQQKELPNILQEAARIARRDVTVLSTSHAAADHTVHLSYPEGQYLTAMLVCVH